MAVGGTRGGYQPDSRVQTLRDELLMEALVGANDPSAERRQQTFDEIARLARRISNILANSNRTASMAGATA